MLSERADKAREILARLASTTRFAGSDGEARARHYCSGLLEQRGYSVKEQPFEFSRSPALWGPSLTSALAATVVWLGAHLATRHHAPSAGLVVDVGGLIGIALLAIWAARVGVLSMRWQRSTAVNLVAVKSNAPTRPTVWLCAHIDSKSQTIPMILRVASTIFFTVFSVAVGILIVAIVFFQELAPALGAIAMICAWLAVVTALPVIFCFIANKSNGALDNASGVVTVLLAAEQIDPSRNVGIVITSAEELGLAGARYFAARESTGEVAINCDTVDDDGFYYCMASGARTGRLNDAVGRAAARSDPSTGGATGRVSPGSLRLRPMIPGILADNVAFTAAGWESFTLSRGNIGTLGYVHTARDRSDRLKGTGIAQASGLIAAIVEELA